MSQVTIQVIEGLERGRVFSDLVPPISIGREDDNAIRLNDERVSRFHAKIQEDGGRIILTDLDSTNGTRVNGHPVQMRVLQIGDQVSIGRCLLIFGSRDEVSARYAEHRAEKLAQSDSGHLRSAKTPNEIWESDEHLDEPVALDESVDLSAAPAGADEQPLELFPDGPPPAPRDLRTLERAEVSDVLAYIHERIRVVLQSASEEPTDEPDALKIMRVSWPAWQRLLGLEMDLAVYLRQVAEPEEQ